MVSALCRTSDPWGLGRGGCSSGRGCYCQSRPGRGQHGGVAHVSRQSLGASHWSLEVALSSDNTFSCKGTKVRPSETLPELKEQSQLPGIWVGWVRMPRLARMLGQGQPDPFRQPQNLEKGMFNQESNRGGFGECPRLWPLPVFHHCWVHEDPHPHPVGHWVLPSCSRPWFSCTVSEYRMA